MPNFQDLTGQRFNRLEVIKRAKNKGTHTMWLCKCDCGNECIVEAYQLKTGRIKSCGCYRKEFPSEFFKIHGLTHTRLYGIWRHVKERCYKKYSKGYNVYGARGITVCEEWKNDFQAFYDWSMNNGYDENAPKGVCTLDRIDVNGNYEPNNCRFITIKEQSKNRRNTITIEYKNEKHCLKDWAKILNIKYLTLYRRIVERNWDIEKAFTTIAKSRNIPLT